MNVNFNVNSGIGIMDIEIGKCGRWMIITEQ